MVDSKALIYQPHPVYVPGEAGVRRRLRDNTVLPKYTRDGTDTRLGDEDLRQYDQQTLFYDLFFSADKKHLFCIGPPFLDFGYPLAILCQGRSLSFRMEGGRKDVPLSCVRVDMRGIRETAGLRLDFRFADFEVSTRCSPQVVMSAPEGARSVALATLQKDNDPQWLEDWCTWYCREHGVRLIIIYDNDSRNFEAVYARLAKFHGARLIFVRWPYPYGPVRGAWMNKYCRLVFLEHSRLFFCANVKWCINLDVDEYLYTSCGVPVDQYLRRPLVRIFPVVFVASYIVSSVAQGEDGRHEGGDQTFTRRCFDFPFRTKVLFMERGQFSKFIYQPSKVLFNRPARVTPWHTPPLPASYFRKTLWWLNFRLLKWMAFGRFWRLREPALFFYHFRGLGTDWRTRYFNQLAQKRRARGVANGKIVEDERIKRMKSRLESASGRPETLC